MEKIRSNPSVTLITGGAKCGKSRYALSLCESMPGEKIFLATAESRDGEMAERIRRHQEERGGHWQTVEEPLDVVGALSHSAGPERVVLFDCVTLWLSNLMMKYGENEERVIREAKRLADFLAGCPGPVVVVSNEVGMGIVPADSMARLYRDLAGQTNQWIAAAAGSVVAMFSGIPLAVKGRQPLMT